MSDRSTPRRLRWPQLKIEQMYWRARQVSGPLQARGGTWLIQLRDGEDPRARDPHNNRRAVARMARAGRRPGYTAQGPDGPKARALPGYATPRPIRARGSHITPCALPNHLAYSARTAYAGRRRRRLSGASDGRKPHGIGPFYGRGRPFRSSRVLATPFGGPADEPGDVVYQASCQWIAQGKRWELVGRDQAALAHLSEVLERSSRIVAAGHIFAWDCSAPRIQVFNATHQLVGTWVTDYPHPIQEKLVVTPAGGLFAFGADDSILEISVDLPPG